MEQKTKYEIKRIAKEQKKLIREVRREEMTRIEEAARTVEDFEELLTEWWNKMDANRERKERRYVIKLKDGISNDETTVENFEITDGTVIPQPLNHIWWRQMMRGDFLDVIFDCPYDIHELTSDRSISQSVKVLKDSQKEILFFRAIWQWSPQKIAKMRGQTDRNIRKVYDKMIEKLRKQLYERLLLEYDNNLSLAFAQREFIANYIPNKKIKEKEIIQIDENQSEL